MSDPGPSDEELVAAFRNEGEARVLDLLIRRHVGKVQAMIHQMVLNATDADDLTQEVFIRAIRGLASFGGRARFSTWLHTIAVNTARTFLRRQSRGLAAAQSLADRPDPQCPTPEERASARELDDGITAALASLSPTLRSAIVLTILQGFEPREAARIEGCAVATLYWRVHKARKLLKAQLKEYLA
jgi:RNA polymerase sigma-70 factor (ECF subfamily)